MSCSDLSGQTEAALHTQAQHNMLNNMIITTIGVIMKFHALSTTFWIPLRFFFAGQRQVLSGGGVSKATQY